jgi:hypothetical protein
MTTSPHQENKKIKKTVKSEEKEKENKKNSANFNLKRKRIFLQPIYEKTLKMHYKVGPS